MKIRYSPQFPKMFEKLPAGVKELYHKQEAILRNNPYDPRLHIKKLKGKPIWFSFRITRQYRALFYFNAPDEMVIFGIGHRKDIYR